MKTLKLYKKKVEYLFIWNIYKKKVKLSKNIFFSAIFFVIEISNSESELFKYESQMNYNFLIDSKTKNIFTNLFL